MANIIYAHILLPICAILANIIIARILLFNVIYARILLANIMYTCIFANNFHANILAVANIICAKLQYWLVLFMYYWLI